MSITVKRLTDEPIVIVTFAMPFDPENDLRQVTQEVAAILKEVDPPLYRIDDVSTLEIDFSQMVQAMGTATRNVPGSVTDPNIQMIFVGEGIFHLVTQSLKQDQYGSIDADIFAALDEALQHVRKQIA